MYLYYVYEFIMGSLATALPNGHHTGAPGYGLHRKNACLLSSMLKITGAKLSGFDHSRNTQK